MGHCARADRARPRPFDSKGEVVRKRVYSEAYASLRVFGDGVDPLDVTVALRLPADRAHRKGEPHLRRTHSGTVREHRPFPHGMWSISSRGRVKSSRLATHVDWLLREVEPKAEAFRALLVGSVEADVFCYSYGASRRSPPLSRELRHRASALGLRIEVDHYEELDDEDSGAADMTRDRGVGSDSGKACLDVRWRH